VSSDRARFLLQTLLNRAAHTPDFQPGAYNAAKLSEDAVRLLADFIQRPAVRKQLAPLVGEIRGKKTHPPARRGWRTATQGVH
jgi:hypothetical protein